MRLERHRPVDRGEGHGEAEEHEPAARDELETRPGGGVEALVLAQRPARQRARHERPGEEVERGTTEEERNVQVERLVLQERIVRHLLGLRPLVEPADSERDGEEHDRHDGQGARAGLEQAPDRHPPRAAGHVLDHEQREAAERAADPEEVRDEIAAEELRGIEKARQRAHEQGGRAHADGDPLDAVQRMVLGEQQRRGGIVHVSAPPRRAVRARCPGRRRGSRAGSAGGRGCRA